MDNAGSGINNVLTKTKGGNAADEGFTDNKIEAEKRKNYSPSTFLQREERKIGVLWETST